MDSSILPPQRTGAVAVDPVALVVQECITVTSAMRKHARWAHSSVAAILGGASASSRGGSKSETSAEDGLANRWGLRGKKGQSMQDNPLLAAFARLRSDLKQIKDIHALDAHAILHPFLQVIRSSSTSAPITSLALIAITKFLAYNIISAKSRELPLAMQKLSSAVTHCRFEASDPATDEIVLFRILKLMEGMITGPCGDVVGDESMCEMMETGISMCCQTRLSELLRRSAEVSMVTMCQTIFERLKSIEVEESIEDLASPIRDRQRSKSDVDQIKMDPRTTGDMLSAQDTNGAASADTDDRSAHTSMDISHEKNLVSSETGDSTTLVNGSQLTIQPVETEKTAEITPYSLPSIRELFRVLVDLLDPHEKQHTDTMRVMALRIVDVALEVAGPSIANHPSLASLAKDTLCRHLFQLVRSENVAILNESLRVAGTLLSTCRHVLKLQQELFLSYLVACLHPRVEIPLEPGMDPALYAGVPEAPRLTRATPSQTNSGRSTPVPIKDRQKLGMEGGSRKPDAREAMVESIGTLVRIPTFMTELFVNYDCEIDRSDLCHDMVGLLARNAFPDAATWSTTNVPPLCLDALLGYVQSIADRLGDAPNTTHMPQMDKLKQQRAVKKIIIKGTTRFNENPKGGIAFLASQGIIENPDDPTCVAKFLKGTSRVDKKLLGEFLSKRNNEEMLKAYLATFDFQGLRIDEALRQMINSFRLPGEAPLIARVVDEFTAQYFAKAKPPEIMEKDGVFVLTYAVIMLNTDQHNPNVKTGQRMTFNDFAKNLRGVNAGKDFEPEYLNDIYESIRTREIILPEEHDNKHSFDHAWKEMLVKIHSTTDLTTCDTNIFDADMFASTWKPVVATLSYVFMSATDDTVFSRVVTGFDQCAQIAARYGLHDALDHIIFCLSSISTLATDTLPSTHLNTEVGVGEQGEKHVMVSETAVRFGRDFKAQLATVVLFRVVVGNEGAIREGWQHLVRILLNLFVNSLISEQYAAISSISELETIPLQSPAQVIERSDRPSEGGLFSAFTSYVSSFANDEPPEPSEQEIEYTMCTVDCITACRFEDFFNNISKMPLDSLRALQSTLLAALPEDSSPQIIVVKPDLPAPTPVRPNGSKAKSTAVAYEPSVVFVLELCTMLSARDEKAIAELGQPLANSLSAIVRDSTHNHPVATSRAAYYLLSFLRASHEHDYVRAPVILHSIAKFDHELFRQSAAFIVNGISNCMRGPSTLRKEVANSPDFWSVLHVLLAHDNVASKVFDIVQDAVDGPASVLTTDNYDAAIALLGEFATAAATASRQELVPESGRKGRQQPPKAKSEAAIERINEIVARGSRSIQIVLQMTGRIPSLIEQSKLEHQEAWNAYWGPPFRVLVMHSLNPVRPIRSQALSALQRVLLSTELVDVERGTQDITQITTLFVDVLFPLLNQLLKPEIFHSDPQGMGETRVQTALLLTKVYLRFLDTLLSPENALSKPASGTAAQSPSSEQTLDEAPATSTPTSPAPSQQRPSGVALWSTILQMMERLMKSGSPGADAVDEAIPESIKNILLVMASGEFIAQPKAKDTAQQSALQRKLWDVSSKRLSAFLPELLGAVLQPAGDSSSAAAASAENESQAALASKAAEEVRSDPASKETEVD